MAADTVTNYVIRGPGATVLWGLDQGALDTEVTILAFTDMAPAQGDKPPPGPRVIYSVTRLTALGGTVIRRQWYSDAPLDPGQLTVSSDLSEVKLETEVTGIFVETRSPGSSTQRQVRGKLKVVWVANAASANTSLSVNNQTTPVGVQLSVVGQGRVGQATITVNADGLGGPIEMSGPATILSPSVGTVTLTLK